MLDIKFIRQNPEVIKKALEKRNVKADVDAILLLDSRRMALLQDVESLRAELNKGSRGGPKTPAELETLKNTKEKIKILEKEFETIDQEFKSAMYTFPNIPFDEVPAGKNEKDNKVLREVGQKPQFDTFDKLSINPEQSRRIGFTPLSYIDLGEKLDLIDTQRAAKVSGARFAYRKGAIPLLELAVINYTFSVLTNEKMLKKILKKAKLNLSSKPFTPIFPPVMIKPEIFQKMDRLEPKEIGRASCRERV